jgi:hypothetical protein
MARPIDPPPIWGTANVNNVAPGSGQQESGWLPGQVAQSAWQNWWQNRAHLWQLFFKGVFDRTEGDWALQATRTVDEEAPYGSSGAPQTTWKKLIEGRAGTSGQNRFARVYTSASARGSMYVLNAGWNSGTSQWQLSDSSQHAVALTLDASTGRIEVLRKSSGSGPWADNAWEAGHTLAGVLSGTTLDISGNANVAGDLDVNGDIDFSGAGSVTLHNTADLVYDLDKTVTYVVDMREGQKDASLVYTAAGGSAADTYRSTADGTIIDLPLRVPQGCTVVDVSAICETPTSGDQVSLQVFTLSPNFSTGGSVKAQVGSTITSASSGLQVLECNLSSTSLPTGSPAIYYARITMDDLTYVRMGVRVQITTTNPRHG